MKDLLGGLFHYVAVEPPPPVEQQRILARLHPGLAPLLPHAMDTLALVRCAYGQLPHGAQAPQLSEAVVAALSAAGISPAAGFGFSVGRHFSIRDLAKWCRRMDSVRSACMLSGRSLLLSCCGVPPACSQECVHATHVLPHPPLPLVQLHAALLQRALKPSRSARYHASMEAVPVAVREAAFVEAADCFCALLGRAEVRGGERWYWQIATQPCLPCTVRDQPAGT